MVRVLTGAQVQEERAHENYIRHLDLKPSSYKFYFKSKPTPTQLRRRGPWAVSYTHLTLPTNREV